MTTKKKIKLIYICGMGHNGSTSLDLLLDLAPGITGTSQLNDLLVTYDPRTQTNPQDSRVRFWDSVIADLTEQQKESLESENRGVLKEKQLLRFAFSKNNRRRYAIANEHLVDALVEKTGEAILVDSSKNVSRCIGLTESKYDLRVVHLTRDVRGYVESHNKRRAENGMSRNYLKPTLIWFAKNAATSLFVRRRAKNYLRIKYEDMMLNPDTFLRTLEEFIGEPLADCQNALKGLEPLRPAESLGFMGNRVLQNRKDVYLDPERIRSDGLFKSRGYWILLGWLSKFWQYRFKQNLPN